MDCREIVGLGLCLLMATAGCQHQVTSLTGAALPPRPETTSASNSSNKSSSASKNDLPPAVLVSWGDFKAGEASAAGIAPTKQQEIRDAARQDYERALKTDPKFIPAYQGLARLHAAVRNYDRAIETYQTALRITPNNALLWYELGMSHNYQKNWGPALDCLGRAAQLEPANRYYTNTLGIVLAEAGRYDESLNCFVRASGQAMGHLRLAQTLQRLQQPELSQQHLQAAQRIDPNLTMAMAPRNNDNAAAPAPIERTSYQAESVPPEPAAPVAQFAPLTPAPAPTPTPVEMPTPRVIHLDTHETENQTTPQPILVPSPPAMNLQYLEPDATPEPNP